MTKSEAKEMGEEAGRHLAELIYTDTPSLERMRDALEKYRHRAAWEERWKSELERSSRPFIRTLVEAVQVDPSIAASAKAGFVSGGSQMIGEYIKELKSDGLLKEMR